LRFLEENAARLFERLKKYTAKPGKILDIGAATGSYLSVFKKGGWEVFGIELSDYIRDVARRVYSLSLFPDLKTAAFPDDYFDLIIMIQVIEHISDPMDIIQNVARVLKPGGILYISTPNFASLNAQKMKAEWPSLHPGEHLFFYTPNTIKNILMKCNLKIIKIETMQLLVTGFHLNRVFGQKQSGYIVKVSNVLFSGLKRKLREWLGKILPGDGLEVIARKE
jgi:2-polyprenyl-3-methyl-5-hydroxy-6-metoxy-1,4-benzoquinol methylase